MLTDAQVRSLKPGKKHYKRYDQRALFLEVRTTGSKYWRLRYKFADKSKLLTLGQYPIVGIADARRQRDRYLEQIRDGVDPAARRRAQKRSAATSSERSLETVAREWHENLYRHEVVPKQAERTLRRLELYVFPKLGSTPASGDAAPRRCRLASVRRSISATDMSPLRLCIVRSSSSSTRSSTSTRPG